MQELARILTGTGVNLGAARPALKPAMHDQYPRQGLFEINPNRHDFGIQEFVGKPVVGRGLPEVDEAIDNLCRHPATAHFTRRKLAVFFVADDPTPALVERMAQAFMSSDGYIVTTLAALFATEEFKSSWPQIQGPSAFCGVGGSPGLRRQAVPQFKPDAQQNQPHG